MEINEHFITIDGIRVHYLRAGETGEYAILLHGGGIDRASLSWGKFLPDLAKTHRVIAPDFPGFGDSDSPDAPYSVGYYIDFLTRFLDALEVQRAHLIGISMGGSVAIGFTLDCQERVGKLVLVDSYGLQRSAPFHMLSYLFIRIPGINELTWALIRNRFAARYALKGLLLRPGSITEDLLEQVYHEILRSGGKKAWMAFQKDEMTRAGTKTCYIDRLNEIKVPTLIVHGTNDTLVPVQCAREAHVRIPEARLHWVDGAGHWPQRDSPEDFSRAVKRFLLE